VFPAGRLIVPSSITDPKQKEVTEAFIKQYQDKYGQAPNTFAGHAFDSTILLISAIEKAQSTDAAAIQGALNETQGFAGPDGIFNYSPTNHDGLAATDLIIVRIEGGTWVEVK